jgi:hypothetical protein
VSTRPVEVCPDHRSQFFNDEFQRALARWNRCRLAPALPVPGWREELQQNARMQHLQGAFLESLRQDVALQCADAPIDADSFVAWFESLRDWGPGQGDALFPWLAEHASLDDFRYFLTQEAAGEAGFDDLIAMTLVKMPSQPKLELANNFWDEMGRGNARGMHGPMLAALVTALQLRPTIDETVWESLALANAMTGMAANRRYAWHSIGALGVIELTAPGRSRYVADGLRRLGIRGKARRYFELHAVLDLRHSEDWNVKVLAPLVNEAPQRARAIAEGALIRLRAGARCFERYREELWK